MRCPSAHDAVPFRSRTRGVTLHLVRFLSPFLFRSLTAPLFSHVSHLLVPLPRIASPLVAPRRRCCVAPCVPLPEPSSARGFFMTPRPSLTKAWCDAAPGAFSFIFLLFFSFADCSPFSHMYLTCLSLCHASRHPLSPLAAVVVSPPLSLSLSLPLQLDTTSLPLLWDTSLPLPGPGP
jgi:hypothetical protein